MEEREVDEHSDLSGIADASKPNAGRIYDYLLGGDHNFQVDRLAAKQLESLAPFFPKIMRLLRWFLGEAVRRLSADGFTSFLDFASGLPTMDHIHLTAGPNTKVIYSDIDPVTVAYGQEIVKDLPNVRYLQCDAGSPETILSSASVDEIFGRERKVAIGLNAIAFFLPDDSLEHALSVLYDWAAPGSKLFISDADHGKETEIAATVHKLYESMGQPLIARSKAGLEKIIGNWKVTKPGFQQLEDWLDLPASVENEVRSVFGISNFYGGILEK